MGQRVQQLLSDVGDRPTKRVGYRTPSEILASRLRLRLKLHSGLSLPSINDLPLDRIVPGGKWASPRFAKELSERVGRYQALKMLGDQRIEKVRPLMDPASYEAHLVQTAFRYTGFFLLTYGALQVAALVFSKGWLRAVAALPLIVMVPIIISGANPNSHQDGSLYGLVIYVPYLPVMIFLAVVLGIGIFVTGHVQGGCGRFNRGAPERHQ